MGFAPGFPKDSNGWILFPRDVQDRKSLFFPEEVMKHPAKMNFHLQQSIIEYVAKEGDTLLDPMAGTGTLMIAALQGMRIILIDIEEGYHKLQVEARNNLAREVPGADRLVILINADCRFTLPLPCNHIIFSPPYAGTMDIRRVRTKREDAPDDWLVQQDERMSAYSKSPRNVGRLNTFLYNQAMERVYRLCYESLPVGGTLTIVIKDRIEKGKRVYLSKWIDKVCKGMGFIQQGWFKWKTPGHGFTKIAASQGKQVVWDEDIIIYGKEE